jgi:anthranilate phosphoribosyltransferase
LTNPAGTSRQLLGMGDATAAPRIAEVAQRLGTERTFVIHGAGIDELPLDDSGVLYHVAPDAIERHDIPASKLGLRVTPTTRLAGGTPEENARTIEAIFRGESGAKREVVLLNAGAAFLVAGEVENLKGGIERAALTIDAGMVTDLLQRLRAERAAHVPVEAAT